MRSVLTCIFVVQRCEKVFAPFPISSIFAYFSHLSVSDHPTKCNMRQKQCEWMQNAAFKWSFHLLKGKCYSKPTSPMWKSNCPPTPKNWLCHPWQQQLQSNVCDNWQWVFNAAGKEFWPTLLLRNCFNLATLEGFRAWAAHLRSCHSISIGFRSGLWLDHSRTFILFLLSHSEVGLLVCFGSLSCWVSQLHLSFRSQTDGQTFSFRIFW